MNKTLWRALALVTAFVMLVPPVALAQPTQQPPDPGTSAPVPKLDVELQALAAEGGDELVTVYIVAEAGADLGGLANVTETRPYPDGELLVAEVKASQLAKLASQPGVVAASAGGALSEPTLLYSGAIPGEEQVTREQMLDKIAEALEEAAALRESLLAGEEPAAPAAPDEATAPSDWYGSDLIGAPAAWANGFTGDGVNIAIIDSGVDFGHPDLDGAQAVYEDGPYEGWPIALDPRSMRAYFFDWMDSWDNYEEWWDYGGWEDYSWYAEVWDVIHCTEGMTATFEFNDYPYTIDDEIAAMSLSGNVRWGVHPDTQLAMLVYPEGGPAPYPWAGWVPFILLDTTTAGVYDTVIADLNFDLWFDMNDDVADVDDPVLAQDLGGYLDDYMEVTPGTTYVPEQFVRFYAPTWFGKAPFFALTTAVTRTLPPGTWIWAADHWTAEGATTGEDGIADVSGGMVYYIADGEKPIPGSDYLYPFDFWIPGNGQLVAFMLGSGLVGMDQGTRVASAAVGAGVISDPVSTIGQRVQYDPLVYPPKERPDVGVVGFDNWTDDVVAMLEGDPQLRGLFDFHDEGDGWDYDDIAGYDMLLVNECGNCLSSEEAMALETFHLSGRPIIMGMTGLEMANEDIQELVQHYFGAVNARDGVMLAFPYSMTETLSSHYINTGVYTITNVFPANYFELDGADWVVRGDADTDGQVEDEENFVLARDEDPARTVLMGAPLTAWYTILGPFGQQRQLMRNAINWAAESIPDRWVGEELFCDDFQETAAAGSPIDTDAWTLSGLWHGDNVVDADELNNPPLQSHFIPPWYTPTVAFNNEGTATYDSGHVSGSLTLSGSVSLPEAVGGIELSLFSYADTERSGNPIFSSTPITIGIAGDNYYDDPWVGHWRLGAYTFVPLGDDFVTATLTSSPYGTIGAVMVNEDPGSLTVTETHALEYFYGLGRPVIMGMLDLEADNTGTPDLPMNQVYDLYAMFGITGTGYYWWWGTHTVYPAHPIVQEPEYVYSEYSDVFVPDGADFFLVQNNDEYFGMANDPPVGARTVIYGDYLSDWFWNNQEVFANAVIWAIEGLPDPRDMTAAAATDVAVVGAWSADLYNFLRADYRLNAYTFADEGDDFTWTDVGGYDALLVAEEDGPAEQVGFPGLTLTETQVLVDFAAAGKPVILGMDDIGDMSLAQQEALEGVFGFYKARDTIDDWPRDLNEDHPVARLTDTSGPWVGEYFIQNGADWVLRGDAQDDGYVGPNENLVLAYENTARTMIFGSQLDEWYSYNPRLMINSIIWAIEGPDTGLADELDPTQFDVRYIEISTDDGATWYTLWDSATMLVNDEGAWNRKAFDLTPFAGKDVKIRFRFDSIDERFNDHMGWYVDDVCITAMGAEAYLIGDEGIVQGPAPGAKIVAIGDIFQTDWLARYDAYTFLAYGVDGEPNSGDEFVDIVSMSYWDDEWDIDGWDFDSRLLSFYNQAYLPNTTFVASAGNQGFGYGTVRSPAGNTIVKVGASTQFGATDMFGGGLELGQLNDGSVASRSARGPNDLGQPEPEVVATGYWASGDVALNTSYGWSWLMGGFVTQYPDGGNAWLEWGVTERSAPEAAGVLALIYDAYAEANGAFPDFETARQILMSGADDLSHDVLMQGAGRVNAERATDVAGGLGGVYVAPSLLAAGEYMGDAHEAFPNVLYPGDTWTTTLTVYNPGAAAASATVGDAFLTQVDATTYDVYVMPYLGMEDMDLRAFVHYPTYFVVADPALAVVTTTYGITRTVHGDSLVITPPAGADLMQVQMVVPFEMFDHYYQHPDPYSLFDEDVDMWALSVFDWTDRNGDDKLWEDGNGDGIVNPLRYGWPEVVDVASLNWTTETELNRLGDSAIMGNQQEVTVRVDGSDNVVIGLNHLMPNSYREDDDWSFEDVEAFYADNPIQVKVVFYDKADWTVVTESPASLSVPAGGMASFMASFTAPAEPGLYEGAITVAEGGHTSVIPTTLNVAAPPEDMVFNFAGTAAAGTPYDNGRMFVADSMLYVGDERLFFYDADVGFAQQMLYVNTSWGDQCTNMPTLYETWLWGPNTGDQFSLMEPEKFGPHGLQWAGGTYEWDWDDDEWPIPEASFMGPLWDGLNLIQVHSDLQSGNYACGEGFEVMGGVFGVDAPGWGEGGIVINTDEPMGSFELDVVSPMDGIHAWPDGFGEAQIWNNQDVPQGKHPWDYWPPPDLLEGWVYEFEAINNWWIEATLQGPPTSDVDLFLLYDANNDGVYSFMIDERELVAWSTGGESNEWIDVWAPDGMYALVAYGLQVYPGDQFDIKLALGGGEGLEVEGADPANDYLVETVAGVPETLTINWEVPGPGIWMGYIEFWMPDGWYDIEVPVIINKEGTDISVDKEVDKVMVEFGETLVYSITVANTGSERVHMDVTDVLPEGLDLIGDETWGDSDFDGLRSLLADDFPWLFEYECGMWYDDWMRTVHYACDLPLEIDKTLVLDEWGDEVWVPLDPPVFITEDTIYFTVRVEAQPGTHFLNKADLKWSYFREQLGGFLSDTTYSYVPLKAYLPVMVR